MCAFHDQNVDLAALHVLQKRLHHPRLSPVVPQIAAVEDGLAFSFNQKSHAAVDAVVNGERRDPAIADLKGLAGDDFAEAFSVEFLLAREHCRRQHHFAGPRGREDGNRGAGTMQQAAVVEMAMREKNSIRSGKIHIEQTRDSWNDSFSFQDFGGLGEGGARIKRIAVGVHRGQTQVEDESGGRCRQFDARTADFLGAAVDGQLHDERFSVNPKKKARLPFKVSRHYRRPYP